MWPKIKYEVYDWSRSAEDFMLIPKTKRRKITPSYQAAVPATISNVNAEVSSELALRLADVRVAITRFDQRQSSRGYNLPALILRSESSSSSQIERLTSSVRNVALADITDKSPSNARLIAGNVAAMRAALAQTGPITINAICQIHDTLLSNSDEKLGLRDEQVWIGGTPFSPHGALFVPPHASIVKECLQDLIAFSERDDIESLVKTAIFHAQFETIHPFTDGNGRTGRALLHRVLARDEVLLCSTLPISAGLLHNTNAYMAALESYHEGEIEPIVTSLADALELGVVIGTSISSEIDAILDRWNTSITARKGSSAHRLSTVLVEQPVVDVAYVARKLGISDRAARNLVQTACEKEILAKMGNAQRGAFYQAPELLDELEKATSVTGIRRIDYGNQR
ncbi:MAG: Fic family protein [Raoultibacter sp.]